MKLAAAVIQHWSDEPMKQYPWTKNRENGQTIYSQVSEALSATHPNRLPRGEARDGGTEGYVLLECSVCDILGSPQPLTSQIGSSHDGPRPLPAVCPHCSARVVEGARFCMACGRAVVPDGQDRGT
jgi:hypothetical protein